MSVSITAKNLNAVVWSLGQTEDLAAQATAYAVGQTALAFEREIKKTLGQVSLSRITCKVRTVGYRV
jgi:hypothetical protein